MSESGHEEGIDVGKTRETIRITLAGLLGLLTGMTIGFGIYTLGERISHRNDVTITSISEENK